MSIKYNAASYSYIVSRKTTFSIIKLKILIYVYAHDLTSLSSLKCKLWTFIVTIKCLKFETTGPLKQLSYVYLVKFLLQKIFCYITSIMLQQLYAEVFVTKSRTWTLAMMSYLGRYYKIKPRGLINIDFY